MNTDETVRNYAVISVTTMKLVIPSLDIVADALTVIEMKNAMKVKYQNLLYWITTISIKTEKENYLQNKNTLYL